MLEKGASKRRERVIPILGPIDGLKTLGIPIHYIQSLLIYSPNATF